MGSHISRGGCIAEMEKLIPFAGGELLPETLGIGYTRAEESASILESTDERLAALARQETAFLSFLEPKVRLARLHKPEDLKKQKRTVPKTLLSQAQSHFRPIGR